MLRLPDPEPTAHPLASVPDPVPAPPQATSPVAAPPQRSGGPARNPLFRAIDGGLADPDAEARPKARRGSARRARADTAAVPPSQAPRRVRRSGQDGAGGRDRGRDRDAGPGPAPSRLRPECYGCPVGLAFGAVRNSSPETLDHLVAASREMVSAARSVMEALEANLDRYSRPAPMQRVELD